MGRLKVDSTVLNAQAAQMQSVKRQLNTVARQLGRVSFNLSQQTLVHFARQKALKNCCDSVDLAGADADRLGALLSLLASEYKTAEAKNVGEKNVVDDLISAIGGFLNEGNEWWKEWQLVLPFPAIVSGLIPSMIGLGVLWMMNTDLSPTEWWVDKDNLSWNHLLCENDWEFGSGRAWKRYKGEHAEGEIFRHTGGISSKRKVGDIENDDHFNKDLGLPEQKKPKSKWNKNDDEDWNEKKATIYERKIEAKEEFDLLYGKIEKKGEYGSGSIEAKIGTAEAHGSVSAGLYTFEKDANGNVKRVFSPAVDAEIGASVALVDVTAKGRFGLGEDNNMLGVYGEANYKELSAEAKTEFHFGGGDAYAGASAEADLVKVTGSGGISVLGTDVGLTGSLKVGVGAHAKVGYTDGKLKVDIGAAVGVGADVGFEVDISGTVDAVTGFVGDIADGFEAAGDFFSGLFRW